MTWTRIRVEYRLQEAHDVLRNLPDPHMRYLRNPLRARMPAVVSTDIEAWALRVQKVRDDLPNDAPIIPRIIPSAAAIDRMEEVIVGKGDNPPWLSYLSHRERRVVWRRITGRPWHYIAAREDRSERTVQRWYREALEKIADELETVYATISTK